MTTRIRHTNESDEYYFKEGCHILEWLNTPDDPAVSAARARVDPGVRTRRHRLAATTERYIILEGIGLVQVGDAVPEAVQAGSVVIIPPDVDQCIENTGTEPLVFVALCTPRFTTAAYLDTEG
jgi:mannose-6-phosphate isomerase-like protein (cupin superfamily)